MECLKEPRLQDFEFTYQTPNRFAFVGKGLSLREQQQKPLGWYIRASIWLACLVQAIALSQIVCIASFGHGSIVVFKRILYFGNILRFRYPNSSIKKIGLYLWLGGSDSGQYRPRYKLGTHPDFFARCIWYDVNLLGPNRPVCQRAYSLELSTLRSIW